MAAITNLFSIEDNIVAQLGTVTGILQIYREAVEEGLNEDTTKSPSLYVSSKGLLPGLSVARATAQKVTTLWEVAVVCKKADYKSVGGLKIIEVMKTLTGYQADDWIKPAELINDNRLNGEPEYQGLFTYFPLLFAVEIIV